MRILPIDEVLIAPDRQRTEFDDAYIAELASDISQNGLFHPVVTRAKDGANYLVAGECRLRAIRLLTDLGQSFRCDGRTIEPGSVPTVTLGELSPLEAEEAELSENIKRRDLPLQDRVRAEARLHRLRAAQAASENRPYTATDTATELLHMRTGTKERASGSQVDSLRKTLVVDQHLHDPEVAKAQSLDEAFKIVQKKTERAHNQKIAQQLGASFQPGKHRLHHGDFRQVALAPFDCLIIDPPYGDAAHQYGTQGSSDRQYIDDPVVWQQLMEDLSRLSYSAGKEQSHAYIFCTIEKFSTLVATLLLGGWDVWPRPLIWDKSNGVAPRPEHGPRYTYEAIVFASKGSRKIRYLAPDVLRFPSANTTGHPDEKPVALYSELIRRSCLPGDAVADWMCGSGTILDAAEATKTYAFAVEREAEYYAIASKRLSK